MINFNIKKSGLSMLALMFIFSCADPDLGPLLTLDSVDLGAYVRGVSVSNTEFDLNDLPNSNYSYGVEFVSDKDGVDIEKYEVWIQMYDKGTNSYGESKLHQTIDKSQFVKNGNGLPSVDVTISVADAAATLNVTEASLAAGDFFRFNGIIETDKGYRFGYDNSTAPVRGSAFGGYFRQDCYFTCPLKDTEYVGTYMAEYVGVPTNNCYGTPAWGSGALPNFKLELVANSTTLRKLTAVDANGTAQRIAGWAFGFTYAPSAQLNFVCTEVSLSQAFALNASCGGGINVTQGSTGPDAIDPILSNDGTFTLTLQEFENHDCDCDNYDFVVKFTKI